ncbi:MAG: hypothetical protein QOJ78_53, partial [Pseudonocardiales bacterium]|nr:hypothetical protein [Pseudonocardiales bacterium]
MSERGERTPPEVVRLSSRDDDAEGGQPDAIPELVHPSALDTDATGGQVGEAPRALRDLLKRHAVDTRPLAIPAYKRLLIGQGTSFIGSMLTQVAVPVQVYALTGSSLYVGLVGLAGLVPIVVFGLYGGAIADAVDRR